MSTESRFELINSDCLAAMLFMEDNSVDSIVTDPPYGLSFMGKAWDHGVPSSVIWAEALRVLKPGGHLLSFGGSRTYHRMASAIEDAGFEIRDQIMWVYGSGFPKSLDVSKAIDKAAGAEREVVGERKKLQSYGADVNDVYGGGPDKGGVQLITTAATDAAKQWDGWGTALKPAFEPLVVAIKPLLSGTELDIINVNLSTLEARLWSLLLANAAEKISTSNQNELNAACAIARWTADDCISTQAALCAQMDTSQFEWATNTSLSIVSSWRSTLVEFSKHGSTSITGTKSSTTTCWKTLSYCLSQITPDTIITGRFPQADRNAPASNAERYFSAELKRLNAIQELSAVGIAISLDRQNSLDVDASVKHEPIVVARKPLIGTVVANVLAHGTGGLNIDGCRVGTEDMSGQWDRTWNDNSGEFGERYPQSGREAGKTVPPGRWPANWIHNGSEEVLAGFPDSNGSAARFFYCAKASRKDRDEGLDGHDTVIIERSLTSESPKWGNADQQVVLQVDTEPSPPKVIAVSGVSNKSAHEWSTLLFGSEHTAPCLQGTTCIIETPTSSTTGLTTLSYFQNLLTSANTQVANYETESGGSPAQTAAPGTLLLRTTSGLMASALGVEHAASPTLLKISVSARRSDHPTVKPTDLMAYLCRLVTPPGGIVLDPFMGSGSTGKAALREGFRFIGIERDASYMAIAEARVK